MKPWVRIPRSELPARLWRKIRNAHCFQAHAACPKADRLRAVADPWAQAAGQESFLAQGAGLLLVSGT